MEVNQNDDGWSLLPEHMRPGMELYLNHGIPPGGFMEAVLCNDLAGAVGRADAVNQRRLVDIVRFLQWHAPASCWGDVVAYSEWCLRGGLEGMAALKGLTDDNDTRREDAVDQDQTGPYNPGAW